MSDQSQELAYSNALPGLSRVRALRPADPPPREEVLGLLSRCSYLHLTEGTRYLLRYLSNLTPAERFTHAVSSVMFRLTESDGQSPDPCLAAEEQAFLEELWYSHLPDVCKDTVVRLLCLNERYVLSRVLRNPIKKLSEQS